MLEMLDALAAMPTWLVDLVDATKVRAALEAALPEARAGDIAIVACEPGRLRLKKGGWSGGYLVTVQGPSDPEPRHVRLRGSLLGSGPPGLPSPVAPFGDAEWRATLPGLRLLLETEPADAELPSLSILTDPEAARDLLEQAIGQAYDGYRLTSCEPVILRHKPGSRCTLRYKLTYQGSPEPGWPDVVFVKAYRGDKGRVAWQGLTELWQSPLRSDGVSLAEPLAYLPELSVLVQGRVPGDHTLRDALRAAAGSGRARDLDSARDAVRTTARGLVALHRSGARAGAEVTWQDELGEMRGVIDWIAGFAPKFGPVGNEVLGRLEEMAETVPADPEVPSHGSFRPDQVLLDGSGIGFVDFDGFCLAEPAHDLALFMTTVRRLGSRPSEDAMLAGLAEEFGSEYAQHATVSPVRIALWEALDLFAGVLNGWTKVKPDKASAALAALEDHLAGGWLTT